METVTLTSADGVPLDAAVHASSVACDRGAVLLVHGITVDKDEGGGMFVRLADRLAAAGFNVLRFSFRGHGASGGSSRGMTVAGECLDLQAAEYYVSARFPGQFSVVAASFGAVPTMLCLPRLADIGRLVLWNPVLDLRHTFVEPTLSWGIQNFGPPQQRRLADTGILTVDGEFTLGRELFCEFEQCRPLERFLSSAVPTLVVHGDRDTAVSYDIAADAARARPATELYTVAGSDHGFDSPEREDEAIAVTVDWLVEQPSVAS